MKLLTLILLSITFIVADEQKKEEGCGCKKVYLVKTDFTNNNLPIVLSGPNANWSYFSDPASGFIGNGGQLLPSKQGAVLDASTFYRFWPQSPFPELPRVQYSIYDLTPIPIVPNRKTTFSFKMSAETFNTEKTPVPTEYLSGPNDFRLAAAGPFVTDFTTNILLDFIMTNDRIYAGYSRISLGLLTAPYADFEYYIPVAKRCKNKSHDLDIIVNSFNKSVSYKVDGKIVFSVSNIGFRLPSRQFMIKDVGTGPEQDVFPQALWYGFGTTNQMDVYPSCGNGVPCPVTVKGLSNSQNNLGPQAYDPRVGPPTIATYWDDNGLNANWLWGQGTKSVVKNIEVYYTQ